MSDAKMTAAAERLYMALSDAYETAVREQDFTLAAKLRDLRHDHGIKPKSTPATTAPRAAENSDVDGGRNMAGQPSSSPTLTEQRVREIACEEDAIALDEHLTQAHHWVSDGLSKLDARIAAVEKDPRVPPVFNDKIRAINERLDAYVLPSINALCSRVEAVEWVNEKIPRESPAPPPDELERLKDAVIEAARKLRGGYMPTKDVPEGGWKGPGNKFRDALDALDAYDAARASSKEHQ